MDGRNAWRRHQARNIRRAGQSCRHGARSAVGGRQRHSRRAARRTICTSAEGAEDEPAAARAATIDRAGDARSGKFAGAGCGQRGRSRRRCAVQGCRPRHGFGADAHLSRRAVRHGAGRRPAPGQLGREACDHHRGGRIPRDGFLRASRCRTGQRAVRCVVVAGWSVRPTSVLAQCGQRLRGRVRPRRDRPAGVERRSSSASHHVVGRGADAARAADRLAALRDARHQRHLAREGDARQPAPAARRRRCAACARRAAAAAEQVAGAVRFGHVGHQLGEVGAAGRRAPARVRGKSGRDRVEWPGAGEDARARAREVGRRQFGQHHPTAPVRRNTPRRWPRRPRPPRPPRPRLASGVAAPGAGHSLASLCSDRSG